MNNRINCLTNRSLKRVLCILLSLIFIIGTAGVFPAASFSAKKTKPSKAVKNVFAYLSEKAASPGFEDTWTVIGAVRGKRKLPKGYKKTYYKNTVKYLSDNNWSITENRYTEYSKIILAMTAIGKDARDIEGHNLFEYLSDFENVKKQGINGVAYALLALNSHIGYDIPHNPKAATQNSEKVMLDYILEKEGEDGGWYIMGGYADADITAIVLQAIAPYRESDDRVSKAVDRALDFLSKSRNDEGGYLALLGSSRIESSESISQVIISLTALDIDPTKDLEYASGTGRKGIYERLMDYYVTIETGKGGFAHILPDTGDAEVNDLASVEGMCAAASLYRLRKGLTSFYDMNDVVFGK